MKRFALGFLCGLAAALAGSSLLGEPAPPAPAALEASASTRGPTEPSTSPPTEPSTRPPTEQADALRERVAELEAQLQSLEMSGAWARGRLAGLEGVPADWSEDVPAALLPQTFEDQLRAQVEALDGEVQALDCSEYPCVAAIRWPDGAAEADLFADIDALQTALGAGEGGALEGSARTSRYGEPDRPDEVIAITAFAIWSPELDDPGIRVDVRGRELVGELSTQE